MNELKRLVQIIVTNNSKTLPIIDHSDDSSLEGKLYQFIKKNKLVSDEEACLFLYGEKKLSPSYRMLKSRLRKKLLNGLLFTELTENHFRTSTILHSECLLLLQQANKLVNFGDLALADKIADQVIIIAEKAELNDLLAKAYEIKQEADLLTNSRSKFEKDLELLQHYNFIDAKEREALVIYNRHKFDINLNLSNFRKQSAAYKQSLPLLKRLWENTGSSKIYSYYHLLQIAYLESMGDFEGVVNFVDDSERILTDGKINRYWFNDRINNFIKVYALLRLGKLEEGLKHAGLHLESFQEGSVNWFAFLENYLILSLHKEDYNLSVKLCSLAIEKGALDNPVSRFRERWGLNVEYVKLIAKKSQINTTVDFDSISCPEFSILSKDKEGLNLPILILEFLKDSVNQDQGRNEYHIERLGKYSSKYLKGEAGARSRLFIKLLLLSMKEEWDKLEKKAAPLLEKIKSTPPPRDPIAEVEIIPYEHLWELVIAIADKRTNSN